MSKPVVVVGAGGFGRETVDVIEAMNATAVSPPFDLVGVIDDKPSEINLARLAARGVRFRGSVDEWLAEAADACYVIGVGQPAARGAIAIKLDTAGKEAATVVHPSATIAARSSLGAGCVVCAGVRITNNVVVGRHTHLNLNVTVGHDCVIGDCVSVNPLVAISGDCVLEDGVMMGTGSVVLQGITIGRRSVAGASACVVKDVPSDTVVKGVPAR